MSGGSPQLSVRLRNFSAEDPGTWAPLLGWAEAADRAGVDRTRRGVRRDTDLVVGLNALRPGPSPPVPGTSDDGERCPIRAAPWHIPFPVAPSTPYPRSPSDPGPGIGRIRRAMDAAGRAGEPLQVVGLLPSDLADVPGMAAAGITDFRYHGPIPAGTIEAESFFADLVQRFRAAAAEPTDVDPTKD